MPEPSPVTRLRPVVYSAERRLIADTVVTGWPGPVGTHSPAMCDICRHVLPGKMREM